MRSALKGFIVASGLVALLPLAGATSASAAPARTVKAVTHAQDHADTTSLSGPCTASSDNGPVWAYDNLSLQLSAVSDGTDSYLVTITAHGSFAAFADPNTGDCVSTHGSVDGSLNYEVSSPTAPDPANLPAQVSGSLGQGQILNQFFGGNATITGGGHYSYAYNRIDGGKYTQIG